MVRSKRLSCSRWTIKRIWKKYITSKANSNACGNVDSERKGRCGRKGYNTDEILQQIRALPFSKRRKIRLISKALKVSSSVIQRLLAKGNLIRHSSKIKPLLTQENKLERVNFATSWIREDTLNFESMDNVVHIDEKWFYQDVDNKTYYILPDEEVPQRRRKSKRYIGKTMFLTAVARPR
jgi:hypothetical protein